MNINKMTIVCSDVAAFRSLLRSLSLSSVSRHGRTDYETNGRSFRPFVVQRKCYQMWMLENSLNSLQNSFILPMLASVFICCLLNLGFRSERLSMKCLYCSFVGQRKCYLTWMLENSQNSLQNSFVLSMLASAFISCLFNLGFRSERPSMKCLYCSFVVQRKCYQTWMLENSQNSLQNNFVLPMLASERPEMFVLSVRCVAQMLPNVDFGKQSEFV